MAWQVQYKDGVYLPQTGWWLDARWPVERSFVSHAHFDHMARHREVIFAPGTAHLMRTRLPAKAGARLEHELPFGRTEQLTHDTTITLYPAGHVLGSAQCLLEHPEHGRLLYTGDFKTRLCHASEACEVPKADVLIMETTFGKPRYVFPANETIFAEIGAFCRQTLANGEIPVLLAYSLGKSQALLKGLGFLGLPIMLHREAARITRAYEALGVTFPAYGEFDPLFAEGHIVIMSGQSAREDIWGGRSIRTATITGWAMDRWMYGRTDRSFPLSDHAGYDDLLAFVERVQPSRVLTLHGFAGDFARSLRARGVDAISLDGDNQLELAIGAECLG